MWSLGVGVSEWGVIVGGSVWGRSGTHMAAACRGGATRACGARTRRSSRPRRRPRSRRPLPHTPQHYRELAATGVAHLPNAPPHSARARRDRETDRYLRGRREFEPRQCLRAAVDARLAHCA